MMDILNRYNISKKKLIGIGVLIILFLIALPITILQVQNKQTTRQRAEELSAVSLELNPSKTTDTGTGYAFYEDIYLLNPGNKNISAVDITIAYDSNALDFISFYSENKIFTEIVNDTSIPGKIHYVGVNTVQSPITDSRFSLGKFGLRPKVLGSGSINFSNVVVTVAGETEPLAINPQDNKQGTYTIGQSSPTLVPTDTPECGRFGYRCCKQKQPCELNYVCEEAGGAEYCHNIPTSSAPTIYELIPTEPAITKVEEKTPEPTTIITQANSCIDNLPACGLGRICNFNTVSCGSPCPSGQEQCSAFGTLACCDLINSPTPSVNRVPPSISAIDMDPKFGQVGTKYLINALVTGKSNLDSVKATIKYDRVSIFEDSADLYDDGTHGDDKAGDSYYVSVWDSKGKGTPKEIIIEAKDVDENISTLSRAFELTQNLCEESVVGHNDKKAKRVNVVFTGANYGDIGAFKKDMVEALDFDGTLGGLFSQEPFRSNKDKFNFWYSNQVGDSLRSCDITNVSVPDLIQCRTEINISAKSCIVNNKTIIGLINLDSGGSAFAFGTTAYISTRLSFVYDNVIGRNAIHEFGHSFGKLADEYIGSNVLELFSFDRILGEEKTINSLNIFKDTQESCLSPKNPWYDLVGRGCGVNNVIDCVKNYDSKEDILVCADGISKEACWTEVGCFRGAGSHDNFRSTFGNIMKGATTDYVLNRKSFTRVYGPVNEREICKRIKKTTGSAGGICISDYGIR